MALTKMPKFVGVYYLDSTTRRHQGKPDRCFYVTFRDAHGKFVYEKVGWTSEGYTGALAQHVRSDRLRAIRHGDILPNQKVLDPTIKEVWQKYDVWLDGNKKNPRHDRTTYRVHIKPRFENKHLSKISPIDLEKMKRDLVNANKAPATIKHCLVLVRQLFNKAVSWRMWIGDNPVKQVKMPKLANERMRFLTVQEADQLLDALEMRCPQTMKIAYISLHTGLRAGEIFSLTWSGIDMENRVIHFIGKSGDQESVYMDNGIYEMFSSMEQSDQYLFKSRKSGKRKEISKCFFRTVSDLGLNDGVENRLYRVNFHTLRHTFASWLALRGEPLYTIKELLRHKDIKMTMRYSHLIADHKREAINGIEKTIQDERRLSKSDKILTIPQDHRKHNEPVGQT